MVFWSIYGFPSIQLLLQLNKMGASVTKIDELPPQRPENVTENGEMTLTELHIATFDGNFPKVKSLLDDGADVNCKDEFDGTPLHFAVARGRIEITSLLLERGAQLECKDNFTGSTPLHSAAYSGHCEITKLLLENGALVNVLNKFGHTALHAALFYTDDRQRADVLNSILEYGAIGGHHDKALDRMPTHIAVERGHVGVVNVLIEHGANLELKDKFGRTPLHVAVEWEHAAVVNILLQRAASVQSIDADNNTALHYVGLYCPFNIQIVQELIDHNIDVSVVNNVSKTAMDILVERGNFGKHTSKNTRTLRRIIGSLYQHQHFSEIKSVQNDFSQDEIFKLDQINSIFNRKKRRAANLLPLGKLENSEECNRIRDAVSCFINSVCDNIKEFSPDFKVKPVLVGSSSCGVKCWMPDEFDYFFVLTGIAFNSLSVEAATKPGYAKLKVLHPETPSEVMSNYTSNGYLQIKLKDKFVDLLCAAVSVVYKEANLELQPLKCGGSLLEWNKVCTTFNLAYQGSFYKQLKITIDVSPALEVCGTPPGVICRNLNVGCYHVLPKPVDDPGIVESEREITWTVSSSLAESEQIKALPQECKDVMILMKTLMKEKMYNVGSTITDSDVQNELDQIYKEYIDFLTKFPGINLYKLFSLVKRFPGDLLDSYTIKTAFLHEWEANQDLNRWINTEERVLNILNYIAECCKCGCMSHHYLTDINLFEGLKNKYIEGVSVLYLMEKCASAVREHLRDLPTRKTFMGLVGISTCNVMSTETTFTGRWGVTDVNVDNDRIKIVIDVMEKVWSDLELSLIHI